MTPPKLCVLAGALSVLLVACPGANGGPDGGANPEFDGAVPVGDCTGQCGPTEVCDEVSHRCVSACPGGCTNGTCVKNTGGSFSCQATATLCGGVICEAGQNTCIAGECSCSPAARGTLDSCAADGKFCRQQWNPVTMTGGSCEDPGPREECRTEGCPSGACGVCTGGSVCSQALFGDRGGEPIGVCMKDCGTGAACDVDDLCAQLDATRVRCVPRALFDSARCRATNPDGGAAPVATSEGHVCRVLTGSNSYEPAPGTGTCTYSQWRLREGLTPITNCRPAGTVPLYGTCKRDFAPTASATACGTGLECMLLDGDTGICMKTCNANPPADGVAPAPACGATESCVNLYRQENVNAVLGVCMTNCSVFAPGAGNGCVGLTGGASTTETSCVPVPATGRSVVTLDGAGLCVPQKATVAAATAACAETDPFRGASCESGLVCTTPRPADLPTCAIPCDVECVAADGGTPPARCATAANAVCPSGRSCTRVTSTTGATLGFCQ